jgi:signal transduction histidine kinase
MKPKPLLQLARQYLGALRTHLQSGRSSNSESARGLGSQALAAGLQTLDLAKLHEHILVTEILPSCPPKKRAALIRRAGVFFAVAITPIEKTHRSSRETAVQLKKFVEALSRRTVELAASNHELSLEITRRKAVEFKLKKSERHHAELLKQSDRLQEQLRRLSRQILFAQEEERKKISRELHDVIAQTLTGINVRLANLKRDAAVNTDGLDQSIARTQRLVEESVNVVHRFARELRPMVLDDLGLIPALHSFMKNFSARTGIRTRLTAFAGVERLDITQRTMLYRVAQEALNNVSRHAPDSQASVTIEKSDGAISMKISDNGKGFDKESASHRRNNKRLGLLGMGERIKMVNGSFAVESVVGKGTAILVRIPFSTVRTNPRRQANLKSV